MKITVDIDFTPEEARHFLGLPEVKPMQDALMREIEERMRAGLKAMDPEAMLRAWMPASAQGFEQMQKFWSGLADAAARGSQGSGRGGRGGGS